MEAVEWVLIDQILLHSSRQTGSMGQKEGEKDIMVLVTTLRKSAAGPTNRHVVRTAGIPETS